jgi:hypothetical protein
MPRISVWLLLACAVPLPLHAAFDAPVWRITVRVESTAHLHLTLCSDRALERVAFHTGNDDVAAPVEIRRSGDGGLTAHGASRAAFDWQRDECLRVRVDAATAARGSGRMRVPAGTEGWLLDPRHWLWRPVQAHPDSTIRFELPPGWGASVPWAPVTGSDATYRLGPIDADWPALTAFGPFVEQRLALPGGVLRVASLPPWRSEDVARIAPVARALVQAYGRLPRADAQVLIVPLPGLRDAAPWGEVTRGGGSAVHLFVGADAPADALAADWTATHEFSHLMHPNLGARGRWLGEGLASYYQNVLRARSGALGADQAWERLEAGFGRGRAERRSTGLTLTQTSQRMGALRAYMRSYWSGAAYWLESDLALRAHGSSLDAALQRYAECCLARTVWTRPETFVAELERVAPAADLSGRLQRYLALREFPPIAVPAAGDPRREEIMRARTVGAASP